MSNRQTRRSEIARFRRDCGDQLTTYLTDDLALIDGDPILKQALAYWLAVVELRKPVCVSCKRGFMSDGVEPASYLFAMSPTVPNAASTSAFCVQCWVTLSMDEVEAIVTRVLRRLLPRGELEPMRGVS